MAEAIKGAIPEINDEFEKHDIKVGESGVHVHHKTVGGSGEKTVQLVPLSGGVFQLMIELISPGEPRFLLCQQNEPALSCFSPLVPYNDQAARVSFSGD